MSTALDELEKLTPLLPEFPEGTPPPIPFPDLPEDVAEDLAEGLRIALATNAHTIMVVGHRGGGKTAISDAINKD